jgi:hypothetical protein
MTPSDKRLLAGMCRWFEITDELPQFDEHAT